MGVPQTCFVKGDWNAVCDECGFNFKASELRKRWDGAMVCKDDYETQHPQDLLRVRKQKGGVPWSRPQDAMVSVTFTDPLDDVEKTADPTAIHTTFGPVNPDSL